MQINDNGLTLMQPSLPKGGGTLQGMGESLGNVGPTGQAGLSLPLPVSAGRGYAPAMSLSYSSNGGNGPFGLGWQSALMSVRRRTSRGVPQYNDEGSFDKDSFVGPDGEVLVAEVNGQGAPVVSQVSSYQGLTLTEPYNVTRYFSRIDDNRSRIERWQPASGNGSSFWLIHGSNGELHCLGKSEQAQIAGPQAQQVAEWLLEESVSPTGEHIYYRYKQEDDKGVDAAQSPHEHSANRYLAQALYGNKTAEPLLYLWKNEVPDDDQWLFSLIFDYGERGVEANKAPAYDETADWPVRKDPFSTYQYGFEVRTYRLCRQILMFHRFAELGETPVLIRRLLLEYDENPTAALLTGAQSLAYESDGAMKSMPPLDLNYSEFAPTPEGQDWQPFVESPALDDGANYQFVDLYGEGITGILYQSGNDWRYREPLRDTAQSSPDAVTYSGWKLLPQIPALQNNAVLMDINGDGYLDWLVTSPGVNGRYGMTPERQWSQFIPLKALPVEFHHRDAQFADIVGAGMNDLALIGPKSVRFYAAERGDGGFDKAVNTVQDDGVMLPFNSVNERELVAFSDMLGSGQQHIVRIRHNEVTCWPNLGRGKFGQPVTISGFEMAEADFDPERLYLADLDGSGTTDLLYATHDAIVIYPNQSGNQFGSPVSVPLPDEVYFDSLSQIHVADVQGLGAGSIILSVNGLAPRHWRISLTEKKPYLLTVVNNNMGVNQTLNYRSSAQFWLDEKQESENAVSYLPFPVHAIASVQTEDEITGNALSQSYTYRRGVYDPSENEFRGFSRVDAYDTDSNAQGTAQETSVRSLTRSWYHTGRFDDEQWVAANGWQGDDKAFKTGPSRFTGFNSSQKDDEDLENVDETTRYWLYRALKGMILRSEVYGEEASDSVPYQVAGYRYQVRQLVNNSAAQVWVMMPLPIETLSYYYEQIASDPQCSQQVWLKFDEYGAPTQTVSVNYPRRTKSDNPYPDTLPETSWASSYDDQQNVLRLIENLQSYYNNLTDAQSWRPSLPYQSRINVLNYSADKVPEGGLTQELLNAADGLLSDSATRIYAGQSEIIYQNDGEPDFRALTHYARQAVFDDEALKAYDELMSETERDAKLEQAGYKKATAILGKEGEADVWTVENSFTEYADQSGFYRPLSQRSTMLTGETKLTWDANACVIEQTQDALGNTVKFQYDYRFLQPFEVTDINNNISRVELDAFGRVLNTRFWGTENGNETGFLPDGEFQQPTTVEEMLAIAAPLNVAGASLTVPDSWMGSVSRSDVDRAATQGGVDWDSLMQQGVITADGHIRASGRLRLSRVNGINDATVRLIQAADRIPPHSVTVSADRYPNDAAQQIAASVIFSDGLGRALQTSARVESGPAYQRLDDGSLQTDGDGKPETAQAETRWAVSGRVEYDNKGQVIRQFRPYFLNDWRYANNQTVNENLYADTNVYDPLGRLVKVITAKGYERRVTFYPWFTVNEDENDTLA